MNLLKTSLWLVVSFLFWILIFYWAAFAFNTIYYLISGGPAQVVHWYMHVSSVGLQFHWSWKEFVARQIANLVITVSLYFLMRRLRNRSSSATTE